jgi:hypothetical protein
VTVLEQLGIVGQIRLAGQQLVLVGRHAGPILTDLATSAAARAARPSDPG